MKSNNNVLPYTVIVLATYGDINAINFILKHFEHYINKLHNLFFLHVSKMNGAWRFHLFIYQSP